MRKNLVAMLLVTAVAAVASVGLTSCGISVNSGSEVSSEAEWKQAFENSLNAENYTLDYFVLLESSVSYKSVLSGERISADLRGETSGKTVCDYSGGKIYFEYSAANESKQIRDGNETYEKSNEKNQGYIEYDGDNRLQARYSYKKYDGSDGKETTETYWSAVSGADLSYNSVSVLNESYSASKTGLSVKLSELYSSFVYEGGFYTANLWTWFGGTDVTGSILSEVKVTIAIKDGYVVGYQADIKTDKKDGEDYNRSSGKTIYNFGNYGRTSVKAPKEAIKAIEKLKS